MVSNIEIANIALTLLGQDPIVDFSDETESARVMDRLFDTNRDAVLRAHPWNCATARETLVLLAAAPAFDWAYAFQLPVDPYCLKVLALNDDQEDGDAGDEFQIEGRTLVTNQSTASIRFIKRVTDATEYDALLYETIAVRLAWKAAITLTANRALATDMRQMYLDGLKEARTMDGMEGTPFHQDATTLTEVR